LSTDIFFIALPFTVNAPINLDTVLKALKSLVSHTLSPVQSTYSTIPVYSPFSMISE